MDPDNLEAVNFPSTFAEGTCECTAPSKKQRVQKDLKARNVVSTSSKRIAVVKNTNTSAKKTTCDKSTSTSAKKTTCDKSTSTIETMQTISEDMDKYFDLLMIDYDDIDKDETVLDMAEYASKVFQFKISLERHKPPIFRRIQVPADFNFRELHLAIQCAMGWSNDHLFMFTFEKKIRLPHPLPRPVYHTVELNIGNERDGEDIRPAWDIKLPQYFKGPSSKCVYVYDFGKSWHHYLVLEKILPKIEGETYPQCVGGKRATPPEECISDSEDEDWRTKPFDCKSVKFDFDAMKNYHIF